MNDTPNIFERLFKVRDHGSTMRTEILAGLTTFMTMAYILVVNPLILSDSGMDGGAVFTATALSAAIATILMAVMANYPFALAPGMGLNAFFTYTVVLRMGHTWQFALTAVFLEGLLFILLSFVGFREAIFDSIPQNLKRAVSVGIGLFIALIGMQTVNLLVSGKVMMENGEQVLNAGGVIMELGNLSDPVPLLAIIGLIITGVLLIRQVRGALFFGILITTLIGIPMGVTQLNGFMSMPPSLAPTLFQLEWSEVFTFDMLIVMFTFLFVDIFDTLGTVIGVSTKANLLDEHGRLPRIRPALLADAIGTVSGSLMGTSTVTTFVESASGVAAGGRTGLTALVTAVFFLLALLFSPLFLAIPASATAPALIYVGLFMVQDIGKVDFQDYTEAIPAFLTILIMPFAYSIAEGIVWGILSYVILKVISGRFKDVSPMMYILAVLFILREIFM